MFAVFWLVMDTAKCQNPDASFEFVENRGQWEPVVLFKGELSTGTFYLQKTGFTVDLANIEDLQRLDDHGTDHAPKKGKSNKKIDYSKDISGRVIDQNISSLPPTKTLRKHAYTVEFVGANANAEILSEKPLNTYNNYFIGNDPSKWATEVKIFNAVTYKNLYPNIDVRYYSEGDKLKYDLIVHPGGDPSKIIIKYTGADKLSIRNNDLIIKTSVGEMKELYPYTYQSDNIKGRQKIECKYLLNGNTVRFQLANYEKNKTLIIDPTLIFSTLSGSSADQFGFTATPGPDGSLYSGGIVFASGFPVTPGAYQSNFMGGNGERVTDIGIMKFSANGSQRLYATYIGGDNGNEYPHSLFCDPQGNLVVMGRSYSSNYPTTKVIGSSASSNKSNIIVTKLNSTGTNIFGSLSIGGDKHSGVNIKDLQRLGGHEGISLLRNYGDDSRSEVILDGANNIYVAAQTMSTEFPVTSGVFQSTHGGLQDGVVMKIDPTCNDVIWASYLGGSNDDGAFVLDINPLTQELYVGGATRSSNFPRITTGTIGTSFNGGVDQKNEPAPDGFVAIISNDGSSLIRSTYIGTNAVDIIYGLKFDRRGFPYIMGTTRGSWPVVGTPTPMTFGESRNSQFVAKLQPNLSSYVYSTTFGNGSGKPNMSPVAFMVDRCENLYISGWGGWIFPGDRDPYDQAGIVNMPISSDAIKPDTDNMDFYFIVIQKNASDLLYGTYFGQTNGKIGEHVDGGTSRFDQQGVIYQAICANCSGGARFPTTPGVVGPVNGTGTSGCNLAAVKISFDFAGVVSAPKAFANGVPDTIGCIPFTVNFRDTIMNGKRYIWDFGDGSDEEITSEFNINHTYTQTGRFRVRLIAEDLNTCNERDTAYTYIRVGEDSATLRMQIDKIGACEDLQYRFNNLSTPETKPFETNSFIWDFGDGTRVTAGTGFVDHSYANPGPYNVRLILNDTNYCNNPDSIVYNLRVNPLVVAQFETPDIGCAPYDAVFNNTSLAGNEFFWDFGDGTTSTEEYPVHTYQYPGEYTIRLVVRDERTCNIQDETSKTIRVYEKPMASFSFLPVTPEVNKPTIFYNHSLRGSKYVWHFGDGDSIVKNTLDTVLHQYNSTGTFGATLVVFNDVGCSDTSAIQLVESLIDPLLDVPNAFTPGRFGRNSTIRIEGFGIDKMAWKIYNRWGQKVFETNDRRVGWDGTKNGQLLPMDVYTYTLDVQFTDGKTLRKTGDITLIR